MGNLFLVFPAHQRHLAVLQLRLQEFVDGERDGLTGSNTHDTGGNTLVESMETFLPIRRFALASVPYLNSRGGRT
jgi:hypothetical protein